MDHAQVLDTLGEKRFLFGAGERAGGGSDDDGERP
jgi:hypothetical protein